MTDTGNIIGNREIIKKLRAITALRFIKEGDLRVLYESNRMINQNPPPKF